MADRFAYAAGNLQEAEAALDRLRAANSDYFAILRKSVGKKAARKIEEHEHRVTGNACGALSALSEQFALVNDLGQVAVRGDGGVFLHWDAIGTFSKDEEKPRRPPPAWAADYAKAQRSNSEG